MVSSLSTQELILLCVLIGAVVLSGIFAPAVVVTVSGVLSTVVGSIFIGRRRQSSQDALEAPAPVLKLVPKAEDKPESDA